MASRDIFDELIEALERQKLAGLKAVRLEPDTCKGLFATPARGRPPSATPAVHPPSATTSAQAYARAEPAKAPASVTALAQASSAPRAGQVSAPSAGPVSEADWQSLFDMVASCVQCPLHRTRHQAVFGEGNQQADLLFVGEGPGFQEDQTGCPFVGAAGQLLDKMITAMQFSRESVYIANVVKCRPPGNRNPSDSEARTCLPYLQRQIKLLNPKVLVLLGAVPLLHLLGKTGITKVHGQWFDYDGIPTLPTYHPSFLLRSPARKKEAWEDLQLVMKKFGKDPDATLRQMRGRT